MLAYCDFLTQCDFLTPLTSGFDQVMDNYVLYVLKWNRHKFTLWTDFGCQTVQEDTFKIKKPSISVQENLNFSEPYSVENGKHWPCEDFS